MAVLTKLYNFAAGAIAIASQVNTNFDDIIAFVNNSVVHVDGSKAMTAPLALPASDPTTANQATRKSYVDSKAATAESNAAATTNAAVLSRLQGAAVTMNGVGGFALNPSTTQTKWQGGAVTVTPNGGGDATVGFFVSMTPLIILVTNGDATLAPNASLSVVSNTTGGFTVHTDSNPNGTVRVNWLAIGVV